MAYESAAMPTPLLLDGDAALDCYLHTYPRIRFADGPYLTGIDLEAWTTLGDGTTEATWQEARQLLVVTPKIRTLIVPGAEADAIHAAAIEGGMVPITQAAVRLARSGAISLTEAWRARAD